MEQVTVQYVNENYKSKSDGIVFILGWCLGFLVVVGVMCICLWVTR